MSTSHTISFFADKKTPMIKFIHKTISKFSKEEQKKYPKYKIVYEQEKGAWVHTGPTWLFETGEDLDYLGESDIFNKHKNLKIWVNMGSSNMIYNVGNKRYSYPVPLFEKLMIEILNSGIKNDVYLLTSNDIGGDINKTRPKWVKQWNGKFI